MHTRRTTLGALAAAGVTALAGCSLFEEVTDQEADPAAVEESAAESAGFEQDRLRDQSYEQSVEVADESQELQLTNWTNQYTRTAASVDFDAATFLLFTTPTVSVAGQSANPFGQLDTEQLLQGMVDRLDVAPVESVQRVGERTVTVLDDQVTVEEFDAESESGVQLRLHLGDRTHDGDLLVLLGLHPELLEMTGDIDTLAEGTVHPAERP
jgi:hypothetical protein